MIKIITQPIRRGPSIFISLLTPQPQTPQNGHTHTHTQTIRLLLPTNCLSVFDHFVELVLKGLMLTSVKITTRTSKSIRRSIMLLSSRFPHFAVYKSKSFINNHFYEMPGRKMSL